MTVRTRYTPKPTRRHARRDDSRRAVLLTVTFVAAIAVALSLVAGVFVADYYQSHAAPVASVNGEAISKDAVRDRAAFNASADKRLVQDYTRAPEPGQGRSGRVHNHRCDAARQPVRIDFGGGADRQRDCQQPNRCRTAAADPRRHPETVRREARHQRQRPTGQGPDPGRQHPPGDAPRHGHRRRARSHAAGQLPDRARPAGRPDEGAGLSRRSKVRHQEVGRRGHRSQWRGDQGLRADQQGPPGPGPGPGRRHIQSGQAQRLDRGPEGPERRLPLRDGDEHRRPLRRHELGEVDERRLSGLRSSGGAAEGRQGLGRQAVHRHSHRPAPRAGDRHLPPATASRATGTRSRSA